MFPAQVFAFIQDTQPKLWSEMQTLHAAGLEPLLLTALVKELDAKGSLHVLRHGERPGHRARIHRTGHEPGLREREAD